MDGEVAFRVDLRHLEEFKALAECARRSLRALHMLQMGRVEDAQCLLQSAVDGVEAMLEDDDEEGT